MAAASGIGILATFGFQLLSARYLAPADFGLFAAFLVIVNVAAVGSAAIQNHVTVNTARLSRDAETHPSAGRRGWPKDAVLLGTAAAIGVAAVSPLLAHNLDTTAPIVIAAACTIPLSLVFADSLGLLQGSGRVGAAVWWSTSSQVIRIVLLLAAIGIGAGLAGVVGSVVAAVAATTVGALLHTRRIRRPRASVFSGTGLAIVALTVGFAWLTSADVLFVRATAHPQDAGAYAAATVLVKAGLLLPATLSFYLLPRFVRNSGDAALTRTGVLATLAISLGTSIAMIVVFIAAGGWIVGLLYDDEYARTSEFLVAASIAYAPWIAAQGLMVKMTASASRPAVAVVWMAVLAQGIAFPLILPDIFAMLWMMGAIGAIALVAFMLIEWFGPTTGQLRSRTRAKVFSRDSRGSRDPRR